jgi:hypothetical protein
MNSEGLNQELGAVEQAVAIEAAELAAIEVELADIEQCCLQGKPVPPARVYRIKVDNHYHEWPKAHITGNQLLHLAGRDGRLVFEVFENFRHGDPELISPHAEANLRKHGVDPSSMSGWTCNTDRRRPGSGMGQTGRLEISSLRNLPCARGLRSEARNVR